MRIGQGAIGTVTVTSGDFNLAEWAGVDADNLLIGTAPKSYLVGSNSTMADDAADIGLALRVRNVSSHAELLVGNDESVANSLAFSYAAGVSPTNFGYVILINPAASGVTILVDEIILTPTSLGVVNIVSNPGLSASPAAIGAGANHNFAGGAPAAQIDLIDSASVAGTKMHNEYVLSHTASKWQPKYPLLLEEGDEIAVYGPANTICYASYSWREFSEL